jgi:hydrogenase expression/formation protein HypE
MTTTSTQHRSRSLADERILMKHGAGGRAMRRLIEEVLTTGLREGLKPGDIGLNAMDDGAAIRIGDQWLVITTDSHVVQPIFFPGGDIGRLAVSGTVNDLAMMGATTVLGLTCAVVIEEGFARDDLQRIQQSIREAAADAHAPVVTGDTKVMGRGELDGIILNTTGVALTDRVITDAGLRPGDKLIVTGSIGDHGFAVMTARHALQLQGQIASDVAPLNSMIQGVLAAGGANVVAMKDPTRGGLASAVHEMAAKASVTIVLDENAIPVSDEARAVGELLGIDPLHVANEGKAVIGVRAHAADAVLAALHLHPLGTRAAIIGEVVAGRSAVVLDTGVGRRFLMEPEGEPLPRIC